MSGATLTDEQRLARNREVNRRWRAAKMADPETHAKHIAKEREIRQQKAERRMQEAAMPQPVDAQLYRQHGPFAQLFALQARA